MSLPPEQWSRVERLFEEAQALPKAARRAFAEGLRGVEEEVRRELAALLLAAEGTDEFLDRPLSVVAAEEAASLAPDTRLGPWRVGERIGRGGMGEVFAADRADGAFEARAAVKVLKRGLDTHAVVARFLRERNILARLTHPNIAHLLDAGATPDGRPYLVMERVQGETITDHCRHRDASVRDVLVLMATVCDAVHEAHRQLVVHRDLKPSNVLVAEDGRVKLLDFGIAKLLADSDGDDTVNGGPVLLTPAYAAPEQLLGEAATTATDVYALGVLLYELLTGEMPHRRPRVSSVALLVSRGDEEVTAPSASLGQRAREPGKADPARERRARELRGDLDLIVLKALHREPERRYRSAAELGDDLRRFLEMRPVLARPDSTTYRLSRLVRRHRAASIAAVVALLALTGGLGVALWQRNAALRAARQAEAQRQRAERVKSFVLSLFEEQDPFRRAQAQARSAGQLVEQGLARLETELSRDPPLQAELMGDLGVVQINLGDLAGASETFTRALAMQKSLAGADSVAVARCEGYLARAEIQTGRLPEAEARIERVLPRLEEALGSDHPEVVALRRGQVRVLVNASRFEEALRQSQRVVDSYTRTRGAFDPETAMALTVQAMSLIELGRNAEAETVLEDAIRRLERSKGADHAQLVYPLMALMGSLKRTDRVREALLVNERVLALQKKHLGAGHVLVGRALADQGDLLRRTGRRDDAEKTLGAAARILEPLGNQELGVLLIFQGRLELDRGRFLEAERAFARAEAVYRSTLGDSAVDTWGARADRGVALAGRGRLAEAERLQREALDAVTRLAGAESVAHREVASKLEATRLRQAAAPR